MRHRVAHRKLGRVTEHRISLLRNLATALLEHEHIEIAQQRQPRARNLIAVRAESDIADAIAVDRERAVQAACLAAIRVGIVRSAHDTADGGLAVAVLAFLYLVRAPRWSSRKSQARAWAQ